MDYKEKLEEAKRLYESSNEAQKYVLEIFFPELIESEEKIREAATAFVKASDHFGYHLGISKEQVLAWLEKQGNKKQTEHLELKAGHWYICHRPYCCRADNLTVKEGEKFQCENDGVVKGFVIKEPEKYFREINAPKDGLNDEVRRRSTIQILEYARSLDTYNQYGKADIDKNIAWLEKQDNKSVNIDIESMVSSYKHRLNQADIDGYLANIRLAAFRHGIKNTLEELNLKELKKQGEQKETLCDKCRKEQPSHSCQDITELGRCAVEHEQKSADKVEPKFKVGDWIVTPENKVLHITNIEGTSYVLNNESHDWEICYWEICYCDEKCRLWTINDAKNGDVLVCPLQKGCENGEQIFIFKGINSRDYVDNCIEYYCRICQDVFYENENGYMGTTSSPLHPSTKEQRDLLFAKMKEAGYEWDAEKKKLKYIEPKTLNANKVIEWINEQTHMGWIEDIEVDKFIEKFKKEFEL